MKITRHFGLTLFFFMILSLLPPQMGSALPSPPITNLSPGEGAIVTSPIFIDAQIRPGQDGLIRVTLLNRDNTAIARQLIKLNSPRDGQQIPFSTSIVFEIPQEHIQALLTLETQDRFHRPVSLRGVLLTLESDGEAMVQNQPTTSNWLTITSPIEGDSFKGGNFTVEGIITPPTSNPVIFELITDSGGVIGTSQLAVDEPGIPSQFNISVTYAFITSRRDVRLIVRQTVNPYGSNIVLDSLPISLSP